MKKRSKIAIVVVAVMLAVIVAAVFALAYRVESIARVRMIEAVEKNSGGLYKLDIGNMRFDLLRGKFVISDVSLTPEGAVFDSLKKISAAPALTYNIKVARIEIDSKSLRQNIKNRQLDMRRIVISSPDVQLTRDSLATAISRHSDSLRLDSQAAAGVVAATPQNDWIMNLIRTVKINMLTIRNGSMSYRYVSAYDTLSRSIGQIHLNVKEIALDSAIATGDWDRIRASDVYCELHKLRSSSVKGSYISDIAALTWDMKRDMIAVDSFKLSPLYPKHSFASSTATHDDYHNLLIARTELWGVDIKKLLGYKELYADSMNITGGKYSSYKNRKITGNEKIKPLFHEMIQGAPFGMFIGKVNVRFDSVVYEELPVKGDVAGLIRVTDITLTADSLTNLGEYGNDYIALSASGRMMGAGLLKARIKLPVDTENEHFEISGSLDRMNLTAFNPMIFPVSGINIDAGIVERIDFNIGGNDKQGIVDMAFLYNGLKLGINNKNQQRSGLISGVVNNAVIKRDNPSAGYPARYVHSSASRDPYRSNFNYLWRILQSGIIESAGLTPERRQQFSSIQKQLEQMKKNRDERKENRELKRAQQNSAR